MVGDPCTGVVVSPVDVASAASISVVWAKYVAARNVVLRVRGDVAIIVYLCAGARQSPL